MKDKCNNYSSDRLDAEIFSLQEAQTQAKVALRQQLFETLNNFSSYNLIRNIYDSLEDSPEIKNESIALAAGYMSKELFLGKSEDKSKVIMGTVIQNAVTAIVARCFKPYKSKTL
ncbi:MAG: hypothetical protein EAY81_08935 [Bacteroidetes bacterium]|nr:MAG: hypothetical protein EAY81_08935 [Bacteroidota bacterium]